jgi:rubrerythrin
MQDEELMHAQRLMDTWRAQFGKHIPFIQRHDVKGFLRRKPPWLAKVLSVQQVRKEVELMEAESMRFYQTAAKRTTSLSVRKLLDELAVAEQLHEDLAGKLSRELEQSGARKTEDQTHRRTFVSWFPVSSPILGMDRTMGSTRWSRL